jgi:hypothetical protein
MLVIKSVLQNMQAFCVNIERIQIVKSLDYLRKGSSNYGKLPKKQLLKNIELNISRKIENPILSQISQYLLNINSYRSYSRIVPVK